MHFLPANIEAYTEAHTGAEPPLLAELRRATHLGTVNPRMLSGVWQGRLLSMLAKMVQPKAILEVGTFTGYAALCLAEGLQPGGKLITLEMEVEFAHFAAPYFARSNWQDSIIQLQGPALSLISEVEKFSPYDLVFIDADKEEYLAYYQAILPLVRQGGVILTDNVLWSGKVVDNSYIDAATVALRSYNTFVVQDVRVEKVFLPVRDGLFLLRKL